MKGNYSSRNSIRIGIRCMVFPDWKMDAPHKGSRFFWGMIQDIFGDIITVEVTKSSWSDFKKADQLWFSSFQVWPEQSEIKQLNLFE